MCSTNWWESNNFYDPLLYKKNWIIQFLQSYLWLLKTLLFLSCTLSFIIIFVRQCDKITLWNWTSSVLLSNVGKLRRKLNFFLQCLFIPNTTDLSKALKVTLASWGTCKRLFFNIRDKITLKITFAIWWQISVRKCHWMPHWQVLLWCQNIWTAHISDDS